MPRKKTLRCGFLVRPGARTLGMGANSESAGDGIDVTFFDPIYRALAYIGLTSNLIHPPFTHFPIALVSASLGSSALGPRLLWRRARFWVIPPNTAWCWPGCSSSPPCYLASWTGNTTITGPGWDPSS